MRISIIVPTYKRVSLLHDAIRSILNDKFENYELIIVDQESDNETYNFIRETYSYCDKIIYLKSEKGKSRALNAGLKRAQGDIIAITDDDCVVEKDWLKKICEFFVANPDADRVLGESTPVQHNQDTESVPCHPSSNGRYTDTNSIMKVRGGGANSVMTRRAYAIVGEYDELLGPGSILQASEDWDYTYRTLRNKLVVYDTDYFTVEHRGVRLFKDNILLRRSYHISSICFFMKHFRCGDIGALGHIVSITYIHSKETFKKINSIKNWNSIVPRFIYAILLIMRIHFWTAISILYGLKYKIDKKKRVFVVSQ